MPLGHTNLGAIIVGSPYHIDRTIRIAEGNGTLTKCWLTIKDNPTKTDAEAVVKKSITTAGSADGQITDAGASGVGRFIFHLLPIDTAKFKHNKPYFFDLWVKTSLADATGTETGILIGHYAITQNPV